MAHSFGNMFWLHLKLSICHTESTIPKLLLFENSLCFGLPGCRRSPSLGCLARRWRQKILRRKWNIFRRALTQISPNPATAVPTIHTTLVPNLRGPSASFCHGSVFGVWICHEDWYFSKAYLLTRRATKGPTSWMVPARIPPESSFALIGARKVWSCARDVKSKYL